MSSTARFMMKLIGLVCGVFAIPVGIPVLILAGNPAPILAAAVVAAIAVPAVFIIEREVRQP